MVGVFRLFRTIISCNRKIKSYHYHRPNFWFLVKSSVFCFSVKSSVFLIKSSGFEVNLLFWRKIVWFCFENFPPKMLNYGWFSQSVLNYTGIKFYSEFPKIFVISYPISRYVVFIQIFKNYNFQIFN